MKPEMAEKSGGESGGQRSRSGRGSEGARGVGKSKGDISRENILLAAAKLATLRGLGGLSIGDLADEVGMSKSGLYAHFKSKEELELATIDTAVTILTREVLEPAMKVPAGAARVRALAEAFTSHVERRVFPGGCFFAAVGMELGSRPGAARDRVFEVFQNWLGLLREGFAEAKRLGEIGEEVDVEQAVFEAEAMLLAGNFTFLMTGDVTALVRAVRGVEGLVGRLGAGVK